MFTYTETLDMLGHISICDKDNYLEPIFKEIYSEQKKGGHTKGNLAALLKVNPKEITRVELNDSQHNEKSHKSTRLYAIIGLAYFHHMDLNDLFYGNMILNYDPEWIHKDNT